MNEDQILELFTFLQNEGWNVGQYNDFKGTLSDETARKQMYDFFTEEGYNLGDVNALTPLNPVQAPKAPQKPGTVENLDDVLWKVPTPIKQKREYTTKEAKAVLGEGFMGQFVPTDETTEYRLAEKFFADYPDPIKEATAQYFTSIDPKKKLYYDTKPNLSEKEKTEIAEAALLQKSKTAQSDVAILMNRVQQDPEKQKELQILQTIYNTEVTPENAERIKELSAQIDPEGDAAQLLTKIAEAEGYADQYKEVLKQFPEEGLRRARIKEQQASLLAEPGDTWLDRANKQTVWSISNAANSFLKAGVGLVKSTKTLADAIRGGNTDAFTASDTVVEGLENFVDDYLKFQTPPAQIFKDGNYNGEAVIPGITTMLTDMAILLSGTAAGAKLLGPSAGAVGKLSKELLATVPASMALTFSDYYDTAKSEGLSDVDAREAAGALSFANGLLEVISPNRVVRGLTPISVKGLIKAIDAGDLTAGKAIGFILKENGKELAQEYAQMASDKVIGGMYNQAHDRDIFDDEFNLDEIKETALLTIAATTLIGAPAVSANWNDVQKGAATELKSRMKTFGEQLNRMIENKEITYERAQQLFSSVEKFDPKKDAASDLLEQDAEEFIENATESTPKEEKPTSRRKKQQPYTLYKFADAAPEGYETVEIDGETYHKVPDNVKISPHYPHKKIKTVDGAVGTTVEIDGKTGKLRKRGEEFFVEAADERIPLPAKSGDLLGDFIETTEDTPTTEVEAKKAALVEAIEKAKPAGKSAKGTPAKPLLGKKVVTSDGKVGILRKLNDNQFYLKTPDGTIKFDEGKITVEELGIQEAKKPVKDVISELKSKTEVLQAEEPEKQEEVITQEEPPAKPKKPTPKLKLAPEPPPTIQGNVLISPRQLVDYRGEVQGEEIDFKNLKEGDGVVYGDRTFKVYARKKDGSLKLWSPERNEWVDGATKSEITKTGEYVQVQKEEEVSGDKETIKFQGSGKLTPSDGPLMMAENTEDLSQITQEVFGLDKEQADAAASVMDRLIATMARRAGKVKADIYKTLSFQKLRSTPKGVLNQVRAFHGSPYAISKFSTEFINSGEGAQAFGWGLYFTDLNLIADFYRTSVTKARNTIANNIGNSTLDAIDKIRNRYKYANSYVINRDFDGIENLPKLYAKVKEEQTKSINPITKLKLGKDLSTIRNNFSVTIGNVSVVEALHKAGVNNPIKAVLKVLEFESTNDLKKNINSLNDKLVERVISKLLEKGDLDKKIQQRQYNVTILDGKDSYVVNPKVSKNGYEVYNIRQWNNKRLGKPSTPSKTFSKKSEADKWVYTNSNYHFLQWYKPVSEVIFQKVMAQAKKENIIGAWKLQNYLKSGKEFYERGLRDTLKITGSATPKEISLFLQRAGIAGVQYESAGSIDKPIGFNYVVFDENSVSIDEVIRFQDDARGAVRLFNDGQAVVYALTDPDVSTPLHEMAHVFEHYLTQEERQVVMEESGQPEWNTKTSEFFASGFERYIATAEAPSNALKAIFDKFAKWLKDLYGSVGKVSPRMQEIYDRMLGEEGDLAYHGGNLKEKSDYLESGYSGDNPWTGYYFFGDRERAEQRGNRKTKEKEVSVVDFSKYNLYKPTTKEYWKAKEGLKDFAVHLNRGNKPEDFDFDKLPDNLPVKENLDKIQEAHKSWSEQEVTGFPDYKKKERFETVVMKLLGFEGIDVRGLEESDGLASPDTSKDGSVIFDIKEGTIKVAGTNDSAKTQDFFSDVVTGESAKYKPSKEWKPLLNFTQSEQKFKAAYDRFMGLFDIHIATSIPTFRETQVKVGNAIVEMLPNGGLVYDIGGSEGGFVKAISKVSGGKIKTINLDPNPDMKNVHEATPVKGSTFVQEAFFEGFEDDGVVYSKHEPKRKADVVHESMVFQFITPDRSDFVKEVKRYLKPNGVFLTEEKFSQEDALYKENEAKKAEYKDQYYTKEQQAVKTDDVLVGMKKNQADLSTYKKILSENFKYVEEYWDAGNFRGFVASDSNSTVTTFTNKVGKITSEFSEKPTTAAAEPLNKGVFTNTPVESVIAVHEKYTGKTLPSRRNITLDTQQGMRIADEYDRMEHAPDNPEVKRAYRAMVSETIAQYEALLGAGFTFTLFPGEGEPYKNSAEMMDDLRNNKHIFILPTQKAHGSGGFDSKENPLLENSGKKDVNGEELLVNDIFRAVHDVFGHSLWGNSFGPIGEEIAWEIHSDMYSPEARRAVTTETRGQNSWANFGPHMRIDGRVPKKGEPGYVPLSERRFADQKVGLLPEWVSSSKTNIEIARENLKKAWNNFNTLGAIYDPEVELEKQRQLWKALFEYATAWLKDKVNPRYYDFKRTLPEGLEFPEEGIRAAFNQDKNYEQKIEKQAPMKRKSAKRLLKVANQPEYLKDSIKRDGLRYFSVPMHVTDQAAEAYLEEFGPEKAAEMILNASGEMPMDVEILLGMKVRNILANIAKKAKTKAEEARLYALADSVMNKNVKRGTELGRAINIFKEWASSDPKGVVLWANRLASNMRERLTSRYRVPLEKAMATVEQINKEAADAVIFPEELTTFGYTKEDIRKKKAEAKKKLVDKLRSTASAVGPLNALPEIIEYGFFVFLDGANTFQRWTNEMRKAGVNDKDLLKDVWENQQSPLNRPLATASVQEDIRDALGTAGLEVVLRSYGVRNYEQVAAQLNKRYAEKLKSVARTKFNAVSKQDKVNKAILKAAESGERITKDMLDRAFTDNDVTLTPEIEVELLDLAEQVKKAPEGFKKDEISVRLVTMVHQNTGGEKFADTPTAMYYGAMLSAPATHVANAAGSFYNLLFDKIPLTLAQAATTRGIPRRKVMSDMLGGIYEGFVRGLMEANNVFHTGIPAKKESTKYHKELGPMEKYTWDYLKKRGFKWGDLVALMGAHPLWLKYVPRTLGATDAFFYQVFNEFYKPYAAAIVAKETGQDYEDVYRPMARVAAIQQAWSEISTAPLTPEMEKKALAGKLDPKVKGWNKRDFNRRIREIEDQARDAYDIRVEQEANEFASRGTFNYKPEGVLGVFANMIDTGAHNLLLLRLVVPFTNIVANVVNEQLDWTPIGLMRASGYYSPIYGGSVLQQLQKVTSGGVMPTTSPKSEAEAQRMLMKGLIGTVMMAGLAAWVLGSLDDEEDFITVYGKGPGDYKQNKQWRADGNMPYSIRIGKKFISYQYTPQGFLLTIIGNMADAYRYDRDQIFDEAGNVIGYEGGDARSMAAFRDAVFAAPGAILNMAFLKGVADLLDAIKDATDSGDTKPLERFIVRVGTTPFPNFFRAMEKATLKAYGVPTEFETGSFTENVLQSIPVYGRLGREILDIEGKQKLDFWGRPVERTTTAPGVVTGIGRIYKSKGENTEVIEFLEKKGIFPTEPGRRKMNDGPMDGDEYYTFKKLTGKALEKDLTSYLPKMQGMSQKRLEDFVKTRTGIVRTKIQNHMKAGRTEEQIKQMLGL